MNRTESYNVQYYKNTIVRNIICVAFKARFLKTHSLDSGRFCAQLVNRDKVKLKSEHIHKPFILIATTYRMCWLLSYRFYYQ